MNLVENIKAEILSHTVSEKQRKIGLEVEGLYYDRHFNRLPVNPTNEYSATDLFQEILENRQSTPEKRHWAETLPYKEISVPPPQIFWQMKKFRKQW